MTEFHVPLCVSNAVKYVCSLIFSVYTRFG